MPEQAPTSDYDGRWKDVLDQYFEPFMGLLWPAIHADTDWTRRPRFLDKELQRLAGSALKGRRRTHGPRLLRYVHESREGALNFSFPVANLGQWRARWTELEALSVSNPFAVVVMAQLEATVSRDGERRLQSKTRLVRLLYERRYSRKDVQQLFQFIDGVLALPESLEPLFGEAVDQIEGEHDVAYVTSIERMALKRERQEGVEEGRQEGRQEGVEEALRGLLLRKFGAVPEWAEARVAQADGATLQRWTLRILDADTIESVFEA